MNTGTKFFLGVAAIVISIILLGASYYLLFPPQTQTWQVAPPPSFSVPRATTTPDQASLATSSATQKEAHFAPLYPVTWEEAGIAFALTDAALDSESLTLKFKIKMPDNSACAPLNLSRLVDEAGNFASPLTKQFSLSDRGCIGTANSTYENQSVVFGVRPSEAPFTFTTGGASNMFFTVSVSDAGNLVVEAAPTSE